ncbi:MAG: hypothetical protein ABIN89_10320 [Chitinophagaceae bacterium]
MQEDLRPAFILKEVTNARFQRMKVHHAPVSAAFSLINENNFSITESSPVSDSKFTGRINKEIK